MTGTRVLTALVLMPLAIVIVLFGSTAVVAVAVAVLTILALWEYFALGDAIGHRAYRLWIVTCALLLIFLQWREAYGVGTSSSAFPLTSFVVVTFDISIYVLGVAVLTLFNRRPLVESLPAAGISSSALLLLALAITWAGDTVAYFVGRSLGKHPLAPKISPKKTWEGSIGGLLGSLVTAYAFHFWLSVPLPHLFAMAFLGNVAGQIGDLLESACKRSAGVKDSGGLLPGHGGILDRIDALILCIPVIWYYLVLVNPSTL